MEKHTESFSDLKTNEPSVHVLHLKAVVDGEVVPIENMKDPVFSQKMIGDGYGIKPDSSTVLSPVNGKLVEVAEAKHAYYIEAENGIKILVHIGENTLMLNGAGFTTNVLKGDVVHQGEPLGTFDNHYLMKEGYDDSISVIVLYNEKLSMEVKPYIMEKAKAGETTACDIAYSFNPQ